MPGFVAHRPAGQFGKRLTILSVDGGGVRGLISATVLAELEGQLQRLDGPEARLVDYFDVISGTNFGGLITSMISSPRAEGSNRPLFTAREVVQFFQTHAYEIFPQGRDPSGQTRRNFMALKGPKYFSRGLRHLLDQVLRVTPFLTGRSHPSLSLRLIRNSNNRSYSHRGRRGGTLSKILLSKQFAVVQLQCQRTSHQSILL